MYIYISPYPSIFPYLASLTPITSVPTDIIIIQTKTPQGETETHIFDYASQQQPSDSISICIAKPGLITKPEGEILKNAALTVAGSLASVPSIYVTEIAAAMLGQVVGGEKGFEKETLENEDLTALGRAQLGK